MSKGKRQAASGGWHKGGDPFAEDQKKKQKGKGGKNAKRTALIALGCVAALIAVAAAAWTVFVKPPDVTGNDTPGVTDPTAPSQVTTPSKDGTTGEEEPLSGRKKDYYTFLLLGKDTSSGSTDTIILVSYDVPNQQVNMMSIPRDTVVNVPWTVKKINSVYSAKESSGGGLENLKQQVAYLTGVMPDRYVVIEWKAVGEIVDAVDGVEFDVPRNMNYDDPAQDLHIHINKGTQLLDGKKAMGVIRYRHDNKREDGTMPGYANGDLGRTETQQAFLKAMAKKVLQLGNITKIGEFVNIFMDNVETDMTLSDMMWFATKAMGVDLETMQSCTLPNDGGTYFRRGDYVFINIEEMLPIINEQFNPYNREITEADLQVMIKTSKSTAAVTNGELLDAKWGKATSSGSSSSSSSNSSTSSSSGSSSSGSSDSSSSSSSGTSSTTEPTLPPDTTTTPPTDAGSTSPSDPGTAQQPGEGTAPGGGDGTTPTDPNGTDALQPPTGGDPGTPPENPGAVDALQPPTGSDTTTPAPEPDPEPTLPPEPVPPPVETVPSGADAQPAAPAETPAA